MQCQNNHPLPPSPLSGYFLIGVQEISSDGSVPKLNIVSYTPVCVTRVRFIMTDSHHALLTVRTFIMFIYTVDTNRPTFFVYKFGSKDRGRGLRQTKREHRHTDKLRTSVVAEPLTVELEGRVLPALHTPADFPRVACPTVQCSPLSIYVSRAS